MALMLTLAVAVWLLEPFAGLESSIVGGGLV